MTDQELLRSAGLFKHDYQTGNEGYTLAAVLLLGRDEVIQDVIPHHKTDAIIRIQNVDRYDDRDVIRTNLIKSYDGLMAFIKSICLTSFIRKGFRELAFVTEFSEK